MNKPTIIGRSSSHFTRVTRIFASELGIEYNFEIVNDLQSLNNTDYGGNPALKLPSLKTSEGIWFGSLPISRELSRQSTLSKHILWPENLDNSLTSNMQELIISAMNTEVSLIMSKVGTNTKSSMFQHKMFESLKSTLVWMDNNINEVQTLLPTKYDLSFLEVTLFCLIEHLQFREIFSISPYKELDIFRSEF